MNHIATRKALEVKKTYAGRQWWYDFQALPSVFQDSQVKNNANQLSKTFAEITKKWSDDLNSEWICRIYLGMKMVLAASVMLESLEYCEKKNVRIVSPYLEYYSVLASLRAVVFTSLLTKWDDGDIVKMTHKKTINVACDILSKLDGQLAHTIKRQISHLKACRELISYRAPSSGDSFFRPDFGIETKKTCQVLVEVAQLQTEILESSLEKNATGVFNFNDLYIEQIFRVVIDDIVFLDEKDAYRLDYLRRKYPRPANMRHMMTEGHVEDFFGAWCADEEKEGNFDPDKNWQIIFDVP